MISHQAFLIEVKIRRNVILIYLVGNLLFPSTFYAAYTLEITSNAQCCCKQKTSGSFSKAKCCCSKNNKKSTSQSKKKKLNDGCEGGFGNAACNCNHLINFIAIPKSFDIQQSPQYIVTIQKQYSIDDDKYISSNYFAIWQPPKIS